MPLHSPNQAEYRADGPDITGRDALVSYLEAVHDDAEVYEQTDDEVKAWVGDALALPSRFEAAGWAIRAVTALSDRTCVTIRRDA